MKTKNGIEMNLKESQYTFMYKGFIFYFSSEFYRKKFKDEMQNYIILENQKIKNKYKVKIDLGLYLAVSLYKRIEKRGFLIKCTDSVVTENTEFVNTIIKY